MKHKLIFYKSQEIDNTNEKLAVKKPKIKKPFTSPLWQMKNIFKRKKNY